jgi:predicted anti-sigma-YlaC factor YlaD
MDGETPGLPLAEVDRHLAGCPACTDWKQAAEDVSRRSRVAAQGPMPDLTDRVLAEVKLPRPSRLPRLLPTVLIVVAVAQIGIGIAQLFMPLLGHAGSEHMGMAGFGHVERETAAFNVAIGVALLWLAMGPERAARHLLPLLLTLVVLLALVTAFDLGSGEVSWVRLSTHLPILLATIVLVALRRIQPAPHDPHAAKPDESDDPADEEGQISRLPARPDFRGHPQPPAARNRDIA